MFYAIIAIFSFLFGMFIMALCAISRQSDEAMEKAILIRTLTVIANSDETDLDEYAKFCERTAREALGKIEEEET